MFSSCKKIGRNLDFRKLIKYLEDKFYCKSEFKAIYYAHPKEGTRKEGYNYRKIYNFGTFLSKELDFYIKKKALKKIELRDNEDNIVKGNLDVELTMDVMQTWYHFDKMILFSGDSDYKPLLEFLIWKKKKVFVFSTKGNISSELINHSSKYYDIANLPNNIFIKNEKD